MYVLIHWYLTNKFKWIWKYRQIYDLIVLHDLQNVPCSATARDYRPARDTARLGIAMTTCVNVWDYTELDKYSIFYYPHRQNKYSEHLLYIVYIVYHSPLNWVWIYSLCVWKGVGCRFVTLHGLETWSGHPSKVWSCSSLLYMREKLLHVYY